MGRSLPSVTWMLQEQVADVEPLRDALRRSDQLILNAMFDEIQQHRAAIANAASLLPLESILLLMQLEERKREERIHAELRREIQELRRILKAFQSPGE
jgi:hypothetical protein